MNNIQELRKIIADSKEGQNEVYILDGVPYYSTARTSPYRSIADIRTIVEQAEENEALKDRVAELERKSLELTALCCLICDLNECEQESEDFENIASELIDRALTVLGRTDT